MSSQKKIRLQSHYSHTHIYLMRVSLNARNLPFEAARYRFFCVFIRRRNTDSGNWSFSQSPQKL